MTTPITIVLNGEAVNALFPEGSEARLKLSDAAIKALGSSINGAKINAEISTIRQRLIDDVRTQILKEDNLLDRFGAVRLDAGHIAMIRERVQGHFTASINEAIAAALHAPGADIEARLNAAIDRFVTKSLSIKIEPAS